MIQVLNVPAVEAPCVTEVAEVDLDVLQKLVGGDIEQLTLPDDNGVAIFNETGKYLHLPTNEDATRLARLLGWVPTTMEISGIGPVEDVLVGDVVFVSIVGDKYSDVPPHVLDVAAEIGVLGE